MKAWTRIVCGGIYDEVEDIGAVSNLVRNGER